MTNPIISTKFLLVSIDKPHQDLQLVQSEIDEAITLITTYGGEVVATLTQNSSHLNQSTYIGKGKIDEIVFLIERSNIDVLVINDNLTPSQLFSLTTSLHASTPQLQVWDRTDLILHIFDAHATTAEAKLQIKLARIHHQGPELQGIGKDMSQQGGGIGMRGIGETQSEITKRRWRDDIKHIQVELTKLTASRQNQLTHRRSMRLPTISLVGYTNAGKSTLFQLLTRKKALIANAPFATLDSSVGKLYLHDLHQEAFITDTIGFIQNLPTNLIESFQSTLMETINADLILEVVDISDPFFPEKMDTVEQVLTDLAIHTKKRLIIFNKIDQDTIKTKSTLIADLSAHFAEFSPVFISATHEINTNQLIPAIIHALSR